jgi:hypothetical protein
MTTYDPDCWHIVKTQSKEDVTYRILCSWGGSYLYGASWKMSSGIVAFQDAGTHWKVDNASGSVYNLDKRMERMSGIMAGVFASYAEQSTDDLNCAIVEFDQFMKEFNG